MHSLEFVVSDILSYSIKAAISIGYTLLFATPHNKLIHSAVGSLVIIASFACLDCSAAQRWGSISWCARQLLQYIQDCL